MARRTLIPPLRRFHWESTHHLIPARFSDSRSVLEEVADSEAMLRDVMLLDGATDDRLQGEHHGLSGISTYELVYGIPHARVVNAAFTHTNESGSRFNDASRGAWYAADELETSIAEVSYHQMRRLADIIVPHLPRQRPDREVAPYDDWRADFRSAFHVLEPPSDFADCLKPEPVPECYLESQQMAKRLLLKERSNGIVYPIVRREKARCLVCFRPALVYNPRRGERLTLIFTESADGYRHQVSRS